MPDPDIHNESARSGSVDYSDTGQLESSLAEVAEDAVRVGLWAETMWSTDEEFINEAIEAGIIDDFQPWFGELFERIDGMAIRVAELYAAFKNDVPRLVDYSDELDVVKIANRLKSDVRGIGHVEWAIEDFPTDTTVSARSCAESFLKPVARTTLFEYKHQKTVTELLDFADDYSSRDFGFQFRGTRELLWELPRETETLMFCLTEQSDLFDDQSTAYEVIWEPFDEYADEFDIDTSQLEMGDVRSLYS